jgi:transposase
MEGTLSQGPYSFNLRRSRYMGQAKTHLQHLLITVAMNFARFVAWVNGVCCSATRTSVCEAFAPGPLCIRQQHRLPFYAG